MSTPSQDQPNKNALQEEFDLLKLLDQQIEKHSAPLEAVGDLREYDKDKLKEIQCNLLNLLAMRHAFLLEIYDREVEIGHATVKMSGSW